MNEPKTFASLGPTLLARKGGAKPAMRPQVAPMSAIGGAQIAEALAHDLEDLGWNDMGTEDDDDVHEAQIFALTPAPANPETEAQNRRADAAAHAEMAAAEPEVLLQRRAVAARVGAESPERSQDRSREHSPRKVTDAGRRAAFTLRLDARRHLKLRLASTVKNRSAQQLVTAALDMFLADIPEIEALANQVGKRD